MPVPDLTVLTDAELATTLESVKAESLRRGVLTEAVAQVREAIADAKDAGVTKAKVASVLTQIVNEIYATP